MKTYSTLALEVADGIAVLTLNRPDKLNAFTVEMADELEAFFRAANSRDDIKAIIVTGAGKAFCAGMDLSVPGNVFGLDETQTPTLTDMHEHLTEAPFQRGVRDTGGRVTLAIFDCTKPVIAAINGAAVGIGATMTLAMDFRFASERARIGFVFNKIGIVPEACSSWFLPRIVGLQTALEWCYTAEILDAATAKAGGLVKTVVAPENLLAEARAFARKLVDARSPVAIALTRQMLYRNSAQPHPREAHRVDSLAMFYTSIGDGKEGVASFNEKRAPAFRGGEMPPFYAEWTR